MKEIKLSRIDNIFLTRLSWDQLGGLPGMILTVSDVGSSSLRLCGPAGLLSFLTSTRYFLQRPDFRLEVNEFNSTVCQPYADEYLRAVPVIINPNTTATSSHSEQSNTTTVYYPSTKFKPTQTYSDSVAQLSLSKKVIYENGDDQRISDSEGEDVTPAICSHLHTRVKRGRDAPAPGSPAEGSAEKRSPKKNHKKKKMEELVEVVVNNGKADNSHTYNYASDTVVCYICKSADIAGKFDPAKALELGIPKGPLFGKLQKGEKVVSPATNQEVLPEQCMGQATPGPIFVVIQCPSVAYVPQLTKNESFSPFFEGPGQTQSVTFVIHMTAQEAVNHEDYKAWMHKFGAKTEHIIINKDVCSHNFIFRATAENQYNLNSIEPTIFPKPHNRSTSQNLPDNLPALTHKGENLMQLCLAPVAKQGIDKSEIVVGDETSCLEATRSLETVPGFKALLKTYKKWKKGQFKQQETKESDPKLVFLGTGSAIPSKYRNVTGIYFEPMPKQGILLDAGEGTYGQLFRRYGDQVDQILTELKMVWISHIHADHHLGLLRILTSRNKLGLKTPLTIVAPRTVGKWLSEYSHIEPLNYELTECTEMTKPDNKLKDFLLSTFGFTSFFNIEVFHCSDAYGLIMVHKDNWKLVYSGDTRPCPHLEEAGADATVLIHEATLEEGMEADAREKGHSTTRQAVDSGIRMRAKSIILTHFSQRYPKIPNLDQLGHSQVGVAFDLMSVNWGNLPLLPKLLPPLARVFDEEVIEKEKKKESNKEKMAEQKKAIKAAKNNKT